MQHKSFADFGESDLFVLMGSTNYPQTLVDIACLIFLSKRYWDEQLDGYKIFGRNK
jgi:hypothetical protein